VREGSGRHHQGQHRAFARRHGQRKEQDRRQLAGLCSTGVQHPESLGHAWTHLFLRLTQVLDLLTLPWTRLLSRVRQLEGVCWPGKSLHAIWRDEQHDGQCKSARCCAVSSCVAQLLLTLDAAEFTVMVNASSSLWPSLHLQLMIWNADSFTDCRQHLELCVYYLFHF